MALATKTSSSEPASRVIRPAGARKTRAVASTTLCQRETISAGMISDDGPLNTPAGAAAPSGLREKEPSRTAGRSPGTWSSRLVCSVDLSWSPTDTPTRSADSSKLFAQAGQGGPSQHSRGPLPRANSRPRGKRISTPTQSLDTMPCQAPGESRVVALHNQLGTKPRWKPALSKAAAQAPHDSRPSS